VWGLRKSDPIERFYLMFLKNILHVKNSTPSCFVYGECGLMPLYIRRKVTVIKYWVNIIDPMRPKPEYVLVVYNKMRDMTVTNPGAITWASLVKDLLFSYGLGCYWESQNVCNPKLFLSLFEQRVHDIFLQEWRGDVSNTSDFRLYKYVKTEFEFELYLDMNNVAYRVAISKIRLSSHRFHIERGRWGKSRLEGKLRVCEVCDIIEDEFHCLFVCPRFANEREGSMTDSILDKLSRQGFLRLLKSRDNNALYKLGRLCNKIIAQYGKELMELRN